MVASLLNRWCCLTAKTLDSVTRVGPLQRLTSTVTNPPTMDFSHLLRVRSWEYGRQQKKIIYGSILYGKPGNLIASLYHKSWHLTNQSSQWIFSSRAIRCKNNKWDALMWLEMTVVCFRWTWTWIEALILKATSCRIYCTVNKEAHTSGWFYILQYLHCVRERRSERMVEKRQNSDT